MGDVPLESAVDVPIDPNEPTYCLCNQVSFGAMIGCDNEEAIHSISIFILIPVIVRNRVVPLRLRWSREPAKGPVVLPGMSGAHG